MSRENSVPWLFGIGKRGRHDDESGYILIFFAGMTRSNFANDAPPLVTADASCIMCDFYGLHSGAFDPSNSVMPNLLHPSPLTARTKATSFRAIKVNTY